MPETVEVTFQAQEWYEDQARPAEREPNKVSFEIPYEDALVDNGELPEDFSYEADILAEHENAPEWVHDWVNNSRGPYHVQTEIVR